MPKKKEPDHIIQDGYDIFEQPMPEGDRGVLLKQPYRRKQLAGFVPLWNEFFRCYHLAGVSTNAVYLWAYLRQYEHERREWNAVSDISWPGRRDIAEALGVSITHLPNLLNELRRAGLVTFQLVLPGFEELADSLGASIDAVRDKAAEYGVNPKVDATLYRTADPFTKSEFALQTRLKYCKGCKVFRYCEGARDAQALLSPDNNKTPKFANKAAKALPANTRTNALPEVSPSRLVNGQNAQIEAEYEPVYADRIHLDTVNFEGNKTTDSKKIQSPNQYRVSDRISPESETDTKKVRTPNPSRVKTNMYKTASKIQPEESTSMTSTNRKAAPHAGEMVVDSEMILDGQFEQESIGTTDANTQLCKFGFDPQTAASLAEKAFRYGKDGAYIEGILRYARENARQNPLGLAHYLIERGEDRLSRSARWQQQSMFSGQTQAQPEAAQAEVEAEESVEEAAEIAPVAADPYLNVRAGLAKMHGLNQTDLDRWNGLLQVLAFSGPQNALDLFRASVGYVDDAGNLRVILRSLFDQRRAVSYREQLERVIVRATGKMPHIEFEY